MHDILVFVSLFALGVSSFAILYTFGIFSYNITADAVEVQWTILGCIPYSRGSFSMKHIMGVKRFSNLADLFSGTHLVGNIPSRNGVLILRRTWFFPLRNIWVTPADPDKFIAQLGEAIKRQNESTDGRRNAGTAGGGQSKTP
jgi:hypothetical protein